MRISEQIHCENHYDWQILHEPASHQESHLFEQVSQAFLLVGHPLREEGLGGLRQQRNRNGILFPQVLHHVIQGCLFVIPEASVPVEDHRLCGTVSDWVNPT